MLGVHLLGHLGEVDRVIADALEIADHMQEHADFKAVLRQELACAEFNEVGAQAILVAVDVVFVFQHLGDRLFVELGDGAKREQQCFLGKQRHALHHVFALFERERRHVQKTFVQRPLFFGRGFFRNGHLCQFDQQRGGRQHDRRSDDVERRMDNGDVRRVQSRIQ